MRPFHVLLINITLLFSASCTRHDHAVAPSGKTIRVDNLLILDAALAGKRVVAAGERGRIIYSDDDGATWRRAEVPTEATLTAIYFSDDEHGWAVGHDSVILRSTDGGRTWDKTHEAPELESPLLDVRFEGRRIGYAVGAYGQLYTSDDGGKTWMKSRPVAGDMHNNAVAAGPDGSVFIAGEAGALYRSSNGGRIWQTLRSPYRGSYFGILRLHGGALIVFGLRGKVFRSPDGGLTWNLVKTGSEASLLGGAVASDGSVILTGHDGTVLISNDQGRTFVLKKQHRGKAVSAAVRLSESELLLFGESGVERMEIGK